MADDVHSTTTSAVDHYLEAVRWKIGFFALTTVGLVVALLVAIVVGPVTLPLSQVTDAVLTGGGGIAAPIVWKLRLPRALSAAVAGVGLAIAGAAMQNVLRNPLGSPFTLGISQAAAFGAAISIVILGAGSIGSDAVSINSPYMTTIAAFVASMISTGVILLLVKVKRASPETMILTGVALGSLFTAGITSIQYFASSEEVAAIVFWTFGDVGRSTWSNLAIMVAVVVPVVGYFVYHSWEFNALDAGTKTAKSLGVNVEALRIRGMTLASLVTGVIISFVGLIGFVGLVAPHMVRKVIGGDERFLLPASGLVGALLLVVADTVARIVIAPVVLPVGILTAFIGAPLFIYLVLQGEEYW
jgi:iron complex transport system permease protein